MFLNIILNFFSFILAVGILISVHEFGHFWIARLCNVKVECFSIGFGKPLFNFYDSHGTKYIIAAIPLGGYVKMLNEKIESLPFSLQKQAFNSKTILQRILIISAGSISNFIFAFLVCWIIFIHGVPGIKPVINKIINNSIAYNNHLNEGDEIKLINGIKTPDWDSVRISLINNIGHKNVIFTIIPFGKNKSKDVNIDLTNFKINHHNNDILLNLGIQQYSLNLDFTLSKVKFNSLADRAGFKAGDKIIRINNHNLINWEQFLMIIKNNIGKKILFDIKRDNVLKKIILIPPYKGKIINKEFIGFTINITSSSDKYKIIKKYSILTSLKFSLIKIYQLIKMNILTLINVFSGEIQIKNLSGPISIAKLAGISAEHGFFYYLMFLVFISINLGVINLFPLPILDGGQLIFLIIEKIKGSPISNNIQNISYYISSILLIILMSFAIFNDILRLK